MSTLFQRFSKYQQNQQNQQYHTKSIYKKKFKNIISLFQNLKILKFLKKYHSPKIFENQCPTIFGNSWSMNFSKFMVHEFFGIHGPWFFEIQCPTIFCDFGLFNSLAPAGGGGAYYMIFHYQKHTVLNYSCPWLHSPLSEDLPPPHIRHRPIPLLPTI